MRFPTSVLLVSVLLAGVAHGESSATERDGMSLEDFQNLAKTLPALPGRIQAIQIFFDSVIHQNAVALATLDQKSGWQISVFRPNKDGKFELEWQSGKLADSFAVSSQDDLKVSSLGDEQAVKFEGCAAHVCPDVFSILLYVPSKHTAFIADYVWGKVTYSANLEESSNSHYKAVLDNVVRKHKNGN